MTILIEMQRRIDENAKRIVSAFGSVGIPMTLCRKIPANTKVYQRIPKYTNVYQSIPTYTKDTDTDNDNDNENDTDTDNDNDILTLYIQWVQP